MVEKQTALETIWLARACLLYHVTGLNLGSSKYVNQTFHYSEKSSDHKSTKPNKLLNMSNGFLSKLPQTDQNYIRVSSYITIFTFEWTSFISLMSLESNNRLRILKMGPMTQKLFENDQFF